MLSEEWRYLVRKFVVYDIPPDMAACFDCDVMRCPNVTFETCQRRLEQARSAEIGHAAEASVASSTMRCR
jgi:hypothetical protein